MNRNPTQSDNLWLTHMENLYYCSWWLYILDHKQWYTHPVNSIKPRSGGCMFRDNEWSTTFQVDVTFYEIWILMNPTLKSYYIWKKTKIIINICLNHLFCLTRTGNKQFTIVNLTLNFAESSTDWLLAELSLLNAEFWSLLNFKLVELFSGWLWASTGWLLS